MAQWQTEHTVCGWEHLKMPDRRCLILLRAFVKWPCWANRQNQQQVLLVVISPNLKKILFVFFSFLTKFFFFFFLVQKKKKKKNMSFKGCAHLRAPSWAMTCRLGEVCVLILLYAPDLPARSMEKKNSQQQNQKAACQRKIWSTRSPWFSGLTY